MAAYEDFAYVYDDFMDNIPYEEWSQFLIQVLHEYQITDGLVAELGCGTGTLTSMLSSAGYDMIGIDNSADMLEVARDKMYQQLDIEEAPSILYLEQDMRSFELYGTVRAIYSVCDSINYLTSIKDLNQVFSLVNNYLDPEGLFIFDVKTAFFYETELGDRTIVDNREDVCMIWENHYDKNTLTNSYQLTLFVKDEAEQSLFDRSEEYHEQHAFSIEEIKACLDANHLQLLSVLDGQTHKPYTAESTRLYFIAREYQKANRIKKQL